METAQSERVEEPRKACKECGESIAVRAIMCRHCSAFVEGATRPQRGESGRRVAYESGTPCGSCGVEISTRATKCRHCKTWVHPPEPAARKSRAWLLLVSLVVVAFLGVLAFVGEKAFAFVHATTLDERGAQWQARNTDFGNARAASYFGRAAKSWERAGQYDEQGGSLDARASCLVASNPDRRDWLKSGGVYEKAAAAHLRAGDPGSAGTSLQWAAWSYEHGEQSDDAARLYREAAAVFAQAKKHSDRAEVLQSLGNLLYPEDEEVGTSPENWELAREAYAEAADAFRKAGEREGQALCLYYQGRCSLPGRAPGSTWEKALEVFEETAQVEQLRGSLEGEADALLQQANCRCVDENPQGSCEEAAALYGRAADLRVRAGSSEAAAWALLWKGDCLANRAEAKLSPEAREAYRRAAELAAEGEDEYLLERATKAAQAD